MGRMQKKVVLVRARSWPYLDSFLQTVTLKYLQCLYDLVRTELAQQLNELLCNARRDLQQFLIDVNTFPESKRQETPE